MTAPSIDRREVPQIAIDQAAWEATLGRLADTLDADPVVHQSSVSLSTSRVVKTFVDSAGSRIVHGSTLLRVSLSVSATAADGSHTQGLATLWTGGMSSRRYDAFGQVEHYDRDFQMDSAFYNRTGFTSGWGFGAYSFYPSAKGRFAFIKRVVPFVFWQGGQDRVQNGSDNLAVPGIRVHTGRQGFFRADYVGGHEPWVGNHYKRGRWRAFGRGSRGRRSHAGRARARARAGALPERARLRFQELVSQRHSNIRDRSARVCR